MLKDPATSHNGHVYKVQKKEIFDVLSEHLETRKSQAQSKSSNYAIAGDSLMRPNVLVEDSEEEEEARTSDTFKLGSVYKDRGESLKLICIESFNIAEYRGSQIVKAAKIINQVSTQITQDISAIENQIIDSDDDQQSQPLDLSKQNQLNSGREADSTKLIFLPSDILETSYDPTPTFDVLQKDSTVNAQLRSTDGPMIDEVMDSLSTLNSNKTHHQFSTVKSYPLRERTFQQRKPYTADKQQHARLIGSRGMFAQKLRSDERQPTQDEEDSDYEDQDNTITIENDESNEPNQSIGPMFMSDTFHDLDDDGLPSITELRRQFHSLASKSAANKIKDKSLKIPAVKLLPALSSRAKKRLQRLALQEVEPLDPVDKKPDNTTFYDVNFSNEDEIHPVSPEVISSISILAGNNNDSSDEIQMETNTENDYNQTTTKKSKKIRQHVLPMAFFKRNLLPDDAIALRSMRTKSGRSDRGESGTHHELDETQLAHHAKRRLAPSRHGDSLLDFMARLGQDGSDSDGELQSEVSSTSDQQDLCYLLDNSDLNAGPNLTKDISFVRNDWNQDFQNSLSTASRRLISSDTDQINLTSGESDNEYPMRRTQDTSSLRSIPRGKISFVRNEREDMIDRMTVRSSNIKTRKRHSFIPRPRKRRRLSSNSSSTGVLKPISKSIRKISYIDDFSLENRESQSQSIDQAYSVSSDGSQDNIQRYEYINEAEENIYLSYKEGQSDGGYDSNEDFMSYMRRYDPINRVNQSSSKREKYQKPLAYRQGGNVRRMTQQRLYRPRVVPLSHKPKLNQTSLALRRSAQTQPKKLNTKMQLQRTLLPHFVGQSPYFILNQPQHVNRPTFKAPLDITQSRGTSFQSSSTTQRNLEKSNKLIDNGQSDPVTATTSVESCDWIDHIEPAEAGNSVNEDLLPQRTNPVDIKRTAFGLGNASFRDIVPPASISNTTTPSGLYFSRDTLIGRGTLSQLLRAMSSDNKLDYSSTVASKVIFFNQPFDTNWEDIALVERDLTRIFSEWKQRLQLTRESILSTIFPGTYRSLTELLPSLLVLENLTILLAERASMSQTNFAIIWPIFRTVVLRPMQEILEELQQDQNLAASSFVLWIKWFIATWSILASCSLQDEIDLLDRHTQSLLESLLKSSGTQFLSQVSKITNPNQTQRGAIHGQDILEIWVCLIQVLNKHSNVRPKAGNFWNLFNRQVINLYLKNEHDHVPEPRVDSAADIFTEMEERASQILRLLREICKIHQFEKDGSSNPTMQVSDNWELILLVLQKTWPDEISLVDTKAETLFREYLTFCHSRVYDWNWPPSAEIVVCFYRYFASRKFRDMPTEHGYRFPAFLKRLFVTEYQVKPNSSEINDLQFSEMAEFNETPFRIVDRHDRCFEIYLKLLAKTIHWQVSSIISSSESYYGPSTTNPISESESVSVSAISQVVPYYQLSKSDKIKACRKLLSSISPVIVTKISPTGPSEQTYSSICNPCNLVLMASYFVPDFIRPSTVGQLRSLLNFEESDDLSRRILLESVFYLGISRQLQIRRNVTDVRSLDTIVDYIFDRIEFMCHELELEMKSSSEYIPLNRRKNPTSATIEATLNHINRLMYSTTSADPNQVSIPSISFLDQRLSRFLNPEIGYLPELRLQALSVIERFFIIRKAYYRNLESRTGVQSHKLYTEAPINQAPEPNQDTHIDDGFSSLDSYDLLPIDEDDLLDLSQDSDFTADQSSKPSNVHERDFCATQEPELAKIIAAWIYPGLTSFIKARHQVLLDEQNQLGRSTIPSNLAQSSGLYSSPFDISAGNRRRENLLDNLTSSKSSSISSLTQQGIWCILSVFASCTMVLHDQGLKSMEEITEIFKREVWLSPWALHLRQQDELVWATCVLESSPATFAKNEELFLNIWFRTIGTPIHELTVQHRFLMAILMSLSLDAEINSHKINGLISRDLFKDLPIAYRDYESSYTENLNQISNAVNLERTLKIASKEADIFQEFKESRLQILAKVLGNIGEHYIVLRSSSSTNDVARSHQVQPVKSHYQGYLNLLLNQIKKDYERLELGRMIRESIKHAGMAHHIVGCLIQHCGLVMQNSQNAGYNDSILNYFTSSKYFPQPKTDGVFIHQKIRGYAYLYQAGEKQFFHEMLGLFINHLKLIPGNNRYKYGWLRDLCDQLELGNRQKNIKIKPKGEETIREFLEVVVIDNGITIYDHGDREGSMTAVPYSMQPIEPRTNKSHFGVKISSSMAPQLNYMQLDQSSHSKVLSESISTAGNTVAQNQRSLIQSHLVNQATVQKESGHQSKDSLRTLTSSLRNVALEAENRKEWNTVMSSFRIMIYITVFRPLLTAFLGLDCRRDINQTIVASDHRSGSIRPAARSLPLRPSLMVISVPTIQWLVSLTMALVADINDLSSQSPVQTSVGVNPQATQERNQLLTALRCFQKETSTLFLPLLQCLVGCFDSINTQWLVLVKIRLGNLNLIDEDNEQAEEENAVSVRALYLFGQVFQSIETIARAARKIQVEHRDFYEQNNSWREALMELIQFTLDHGFFLMESIGGSLYNESELGSDSGTNDQGSVSSQPYTDFMKWLVRDQDAVSDRVAGAQDILSMEASFREFISGYTQFAQYEMQAYRELNNLSSLETWSGNVLSGSNERVEFQGANRQNHSSEDLQKLEKLPSHLRVLWTFQSSFLGFCKSISTLDSRFHRQVKRAVRKLLKPPLLSFQDSILGQQQRNLEGGSIWNCILNQETEPSTSNNLHNQAWSILRCRMSNEWRLFLIEQGDTSSVEASHDSVDMSEFTWVPSPDIFFV